MTPYIYSLCLNVSQPSLQCRGVISQFNSYCSTSYLVTRCWHSNPTQTFGIVPTSTSAPPLPSSFSWAGNADPTVLAIPGHPLPHGCSGFFSRSESWLSSALRPLTWRKQKWDQGNIFKRTHFWKPFSTLRYCCCSRSVQRKVLPCLFSFTHSILSLSCQANSEWTFRGVKAPS